MSRRKRKSLFLDEDELTILSDFAKESNKLPILLVADNLHWWDHDSLVLLKTILEGEISNVYPFVAKFRLLAVTTDGRYQRPIWRETYENHIMPLLRHKISTRYLKQEELEGVARSIGLPSALSNADRDFIFDVSGGHLAILNEACRYVSENGGNISSLQIAERDRFLEDLFLERLRKIGTLGELANNFLNAAAVVGGVALQSELVCLLKDETGQVPAAIEICQSFDFIEKREDGIKFRHDYIKQFFSNRLGTQETHLRKVFSECLRSLVPGDYLRRAENMMRADEPKRAAELFVAAVVSNVRSGRASGHMINDDAKDLLKAQGYDSLLKELVSGYELLAKGHNDEASYVVEALGPAYPRIILAEIEYLRSQIDMNSRSGSRRQEVVRRLTNWKDHHRSEFEQGLRLLIILRSALVLDLDKHAARQLDGEIIRYLSDRMHFDPAAEGRIHALSRSAESLFLPDIALKRVENAELYHRPKNDTPPGEPTEYFRCLNNLTALCISNGQYERAIFVAEQAIEMANQFSGVVFPRVDMIHTLHVMARFRTGAISAPQAALEQMSLVEMFGLETDPFYPENHLGVYECLGGAIEAGISRFEKLRSLLLQIEDPEKNPLYFVSANLCAARFLDGISTESCLQEWDLLSPLVDLIPYETRPLLQRRHAMLRDLIERGVRLTPAEWDNYPLQTELRPLHPCWQEVGRGFRLPDIQFWSMY